jgi:hypothetical protein
MTRKSIRRAPFCIGLKDVCSGKFLSQTKFLPVFISVPRLKKGQPDIRTVGGINSVNIIMIPLKTHFRLGLPL